ncbi:hypothetical protein V6N13_085882 [Hibiscus sabdariffa]
MLKEQIKTLECEIRDLGKKKQTDQTDGCSCAKISEMLEAQRQNINSETRATIKKEIRHIGTNEHTQEIIQELKTLQNKSQELLDHQIDNTSEIIQEIRNGRNPREILDRLEKMKRVCEENKKQILEEIKNQSSPLEYQLCNINNKMNQLATKDDVRNIQIPDDIARKQDLPKIPANLATKEDCRNMDFELEIEIKLAEIASKELELQTFKKELDLLRLRLRKQKGEKSSVLNNSPVKDSIKPNTGTIERRTDDLRCDPIVNKRPNTGTELFDEEDWGKYCYVVFNGPNAGIYDSWPEATDAIHGFSGISWKKYKTKEEAELAQKQWLGPRTYSSALKEDKPFQDKKIV